jgi:excinuclease ABC subunit A
LDEPSIGLHQRDNQLLIQALRRLQLEGNSVLVVEHDEEVMRAADWIIDLGPGAGADGGAVVVAGPPDVVLQHPTSTTARYLRGETQVRRSSPQREAPPDQWLELCGARLNNLQDIDLRLPLGRLICVTGVSGSGKSSLIYDTLGAAIQRHLGSPTVVPGPYRSLTGLGEIQQIVRVDQASIGRTPRSNAATYTGIFDDIRRVFAATKLAKQLGFSASRFSFNSTQGRCPQCEGLGQQRIEMKFLPDLFVNCPLCRGARYQSQTLRVKYHDLTIAQILELSCQQAADIFAPIEKIHRVLRALCQVGLEYLPLGQSSTTLSGGEAQRIKLATQLARPDGGQTLYLLDEPTTGLHFGDIQKLLNVLDLLVEKGNTVVVVEHNLDLIRNADWIVDIGPGGGRIWRPHRGSRDTCRYCPLPRKRDRTLSKPRPEQRILPLHPRTLRPPAPAVMRAWRHSVRRPRLQ